LGLAEYRTRVTAPGAFALAALVAIAAVGCDRRSSETASSSPTTSELVKAIAQRSALGLRTDQDYVLGVLADPEAFDRDGVKVTPEEARALDAAAIDRAMAARSALGLVSAEPWVRAIQSSPDAVERAGIRMSPDEAAAFDRRISAQLQVGPAVVDYGEAFPTEWGGAYIDQRTGAVVASFTADLSKHDAALHALVDPKLGTIRVRGVRFPLSELEKQNEALWSDEAQSWLQDQGIRVAGGGARVIENDVRLQGTMEHFQATAAAAVIDHFNGAGWLTVDLSQGPPRPTKFGGLVVTVLNMTGEPLEGVRCWAHPSIPGYAGDDEIQVTDEGGRCTWARIGATAYEVVLWHRPGEGVPMGSAVIEVGPGAIRQGVITALQP
jgi:hypothetical protein